MGKKYIVGDTGAGYVVTAGMAAKKFGLKCKFFGVKDIKRQKPNCDAMRKNGAGNSPHIQAVKPWSMQSVSV